jgi:hypothetical protein
MATAKEVLISATNYSSEDGSAPTSGRKGDYSFVLLRRMRAGKVETKLWPESFIGPRKHPIRRTSIGSPPFWI